MWMAVAWITKRTVTILFWGDYYGEQQQQTRKTKIRNWEVDYFRLALFVNKWDINFAKQDKNINDDCTVYTLYNVILILYSLYNFACFYNIIRYSSKSDLLDKNYI